MHKQELQELLEEKFRLYNKPDFIPNDPISIPHRYTLQQDIEIAGFFAALLPGEIELLFLKSVKTY